MDSDPDRLKKLVSEEFNSLPLLPPCRPSPTFGSFITTINREIQSGLAIPEEMIVQSTEKFSLRDPFVNAPAKERKAMEAFQKQWQATHQRLYNQILAQAQHERNLTARRWALLDSLPLTDEDKELIDLDGPYISGPRRRLDVLLGSFLSRWTVACSLLDLGDVDLRRPDDAQAMFEIYVHTKIYIHAATNDQIDRWKQAIEPTR